MSAIITDIMVEKGPVLSDQLASVATNSKLGLKNSSSNGSSNASSPFLIGVAGGTASGKSTVCRKIMEKLGQDTVERHHQRVVCISQDSFYRELDENERQDALRGNYNFDHPDALDNDFMLQVLQDILNSREVQLPIYDFTSMRKTEEFKTVHPADVVLFEGILVFYFAEIRELFHMKLFVDTDPDTRLARRVMRDVQERGRDLEFVLGQYTNFVKPAFEDFCLPTKKYADVIIPRGADNEVAIDLIVQTISDYMANNQQSAISFGTMRPRSPGTPVGSSSSAAVQSRPRIFSGSGSFSGVYGSSPPPARPH